MWPILSGIDRVVAQPNLLDGMGRIGVVSSQATLSSRGFPVVHELTEAACHAQDARVVAVFGPQHGYHQNEQDNMRETPDSVYEEVPGDPLPLISLYGASREPSADSLRAVDTLVLDLEDIGCRVYTFMYTLAMCLRSVAARVAQEKEDGGDGSSPAGCLRIVVLDRANPQGLSHQDAADSTWQNVEGNCMRKDTQTSFVGFYDLPFRPGLTLGELGSYFIAQDRLPYHQTTVDGLGRCHGDRPAVHGSGDQLSYIVITVPHLRRRLSHAQLAQQFFAATVRCESNYRASSRSAAPPGGEEEHKQEQPVVQPLEQHQQQHPLPNLGLRWPSPNMPSFDCMRMYTTTVVLEATNISEGRGTCRPFEVLGAPFFQPMRFIRFIDSLQTAADVAPECATALSLAGLRLFPFQFRPTFNKFAGQVCQAVGMRLFEEPAPGASGRCCNTFAFSVLMLHFFARCYPDQFSWRPVELGYEYNFETPAVSLVFGSRRWKQLFDRAAGDVATAGAFEELQRTVAAVEPELRPGLPELLSELVSAHREAEAFAERSKAFWHYPQ